MWKCSKHTFTLSNKGFFFFLLYTYTVVGQCGDSCPGVVGDPAEQRSSFWRQSAYSQAPGAFSAGGWRGKNQSGSAGVLLLLSFKEVYVTPGWLPLIFIFVPAVVLTVWHFAKSNSPIGCTCNSAGDRFDDSKVAADSGFSEWACVCVCADLSTLSAFVRPHIRICCLLVTVPHFMMWKNVCFQKLIMSN